MEKGGLNKIRNDTQRFIFGRYENQKYNFKKPNGNLKLFGNNLTKQPKYIPDNGIIWFKGSNLQSITLLFINSIQQLSFFDMLTLFLCTKVITLKGFHSTKYLILIMYFL